MKDSFVLYNSFYEPIKFLQDEQLGKLLRAIFEYTINGNVTQDSEILIAFMFIKNQLDMDSKKWEDIRQKRSEAGKKHKGNQYSNDNKMEQTEQNGTNGSVNVDVNVDVNDNVINKEEIDNNKLLSTKKKKQTFQKPTVEDIKKYCEERGNNVDAQQFYDYYEVNDWKDSKGTPVINWKQKLLANWEKNEKKQKTKAERLEESFERIRKEKENERK